MLDVGQSKNPMRQDLVWFLSVLAPEHATWFDTQRSCVCKTFQTSFGELQLLSAGSLLTDQRLWPSENVSAHTWVLLFLHSLHKIGKIKALFSPTVLLYLLRFEELCHLSTGVVAARRHPFPAQSSGNTQPHMSPPKPCPAIWPHPPSGPSQQPPGSSSMLLLHQKSFNGECGTWLCLDKLGLSSWSLLTVTHREAVSHHAAPPACKKPAYGLGWKQEISAKSQVWVSWVKGSRGGLEQGIWRG